MQIKISAVGRIENPGGGGVFSNMVGISCPKVEIGLTYQLRSGVGSMIPSVPPKVPTDLKLFMAS